MGIYILLIIMHTGTDLVFQGATLSFLKQKKAMYLLVHVAIYTLVLGVFSLFLLNLNVLQAMTFTGINSGSHLIIDYSTGKMKYRFWSAKAEDSYFITSALDQILHVLILLISYYYITLNR